MEYIRNPQRTGRHLLSTPFIYSVFLPALILDLWIELYHRICFPLYGLPLVSRDAYIKIDRQKLSYLSWYDKLNCAYCGYVNGVFRYAMVIAARTEGYWCGIKHAETETYEEPEHQKNFLPYGDKAAFMAVIEEGEEIKSGKAGDRIIAR